MIHKYIYHCNEEVYFKSEKSGAIKAFPLGSLIATGYNSIVLFGIGRLHMICRAKNGSGFWEPTIARRKGLAKRTMVDIENKWEAYHRTVNGKDIIDGHS